MNCIKFSVIFYHANKTVLYTTVPVNFMYYFRNNTKLHSNVLHENWVSGNCSIMMPIGKNPV